MWVFFCVGALTFRHANWSFDTMNVVLFIQRFCFSSVNYILIESLHLWKAYFGICNDGKIFQYQRSTYLAKKELAELNYSCGRADNDFFSSEYDLFESIPAFYRKCSSIDIIGILQLCHPWMNNLTSKMTKILPDHVISCQLQSDWVTICLFFCSLSICFLNFEVILLSRLN